jgi:hypothetical protein
MSRSLHLGDVARYWGLSRQERLAWLGAFGAVFIARAGLRAVSLQRLANVLGLEVCRDVASSRFNDAADVLATAARVRGVLARWPSKSRCLVGALAVGLLLRDRRPTLFIGVRRRGSTVTAHAWLDVEGARVPVTLPDDSFDFVILRRSRLA